MKLFKKIWNRIKGLFFRRSLSIEQIISEEKAILRDTINVADIYKQIGKAFDEKEKEVLIETIANHNTAETIVDLIENDPFTDTSRNRKKLIELHELRDDLQHLEKNRTRLDYAKSQIVQNEYQNISLIDERIERLSMLSDRNIVSNGIAKSKNSFSLIEKSYGELTRLLGEESTLNKHRRRESERHRQEELYKKEIRQKLSSLEVLLDQDNLIDAKSLISDLTRSIKPIYQKEIVRLNRASEKFEAQELQYFKKQHDAILKIQSEQAQKLKDLENKRLEGIRLIKVDREHQLRLVEEKRNESYQKLNLLLKKKPNWSEFKKVLEANSITTLYHFTEIANLKSIIENDGLYSWHYSDSRGIIVSYYGGDTLSRDLDMKYDLQDYVRLSFCSNHPMKFRLFQDGRKLILLEVDLEVIYWNHTNFSDINATDGNHNHGPLLEDFNRIKFSATKRDYVSKGDPDFKYHQAEVLVKTWIPLKYIKNINDF